MFDELAILMAILVVAAWIFIGIFQIANVGNHKEKAFSVVWFCLSLVSMLVVIFSNHVFIFLGGYVALLVFGSLMLRKHHTDGEKGLAKGYCISGVIGLALIVGGLVAVSPMLSSYYFLEGGNADINNKVLFSYGSLAILLGFFASAGVVPFMWLKNVTHKASGTVCALFSGAMLTVGFMGTTRFFYYLLGTEGIELLVPQYIWSVVAIVAMLVTAVLAYREQQVSRKLGYIASTQMGIVLYGFTTATGNAFIGSGLLVVGFVLAMIVLFMSVSILQEKMTVETTADFVGMGKQCPLVMWCFVIAVLYVTGVAPFGGFISKWYMFRGAYFEGLTVLQLQWVGPLAVVLASVLVFAAVLPMTMKAFFMETVSEEEITQASEDVLEEDLEETSVKKDVSKAVTVMLVMVTVVLVVYSVWPMPVYNTLQTIAENMLG